MMEIHLRKTKTITTRASCQQSKSLFLSAPLPAIQFDSTSGAWKHFFTLFYHCFSRSVSCMNVNGAAAYLCISYARIGWLSIVSFRSTTAIFVVLIVVDKHLIIFGFRIKFHSYICATVLLKCKTSYNCCLIFFGFSHSFLNEENGTQMLNGTFSVEDIQGPENMIFRLTGELKWRRVLTL